MRCHGSGDILPNGLLLKRTSTFEKQIVAPPLLEPRPLQPPRLLEPGEQSVVGAEGEAEAPLAVEPPVRPEVLDDVGEQVGPLHPAAGGLRGQRREVDVEVVVRRLVVEVHAQLAGGKAVALEDGLLGHREGKRDTELEGKRDTQSEGHGDRGSAQGQKVSSRLLLA